MELFFIANEQYIKENKDKYNEKYIEEPKENKIINIILLNMDYIYHIYNENNKQLLLLLPDNPKQLSKFYYIFIEDIFNKYSINNSIAKRKYNLFCILYHKFDFIILIIHIIFLLILFYYSLFNKKYLFISSFVVLSMLIFYFKIFIS
jgi:magnesium-transporting ATPase (P-type)